MADPVFPTTSHRVPALGKRKGRDGNMSDDRRAGLAPYEGNDMAGYALSHGGFELAGDPGTIRSITNVRDTAIIVTDWAIFRLRPHRGTGFAVERVAAL